MQFKRLTHEYIIHGEKYKSWSSIIKLVEPKKDWDSIAEKYAKKHKKTKEAVLAEWEIESTDGKEKGTLFHSLKEQEDISLADQPVYFTEEVEGVKEIRNLEELEDGIYPELALYNNEYQACGTADKVIIETIGGVRYVDISDYKATKTIDLESYYNFKEGYSKLDPPLQHIMDCNFMKYSLQLSMYAFFLEKYNFVPRKLTLIHLITKSLDEFPPKDSPKYIIEYKGKQYYVSEEVEYDVKYMKKEVKALLQYHKLKSK